ncbi:MAG: molybdopterin molybdotransferase MoeA [Clostridiales bacterium]|nr:molybdopterin molybdotransferase MoeA [Clostridiales bacterium]
MENLTLSEAEELLLANVSPIGETEDISLWDAHGRVLAEDIIASSNHPPFSRSPLDGYALRSEDIQGASKDHPVTLRVIDEVTAGHCTHKTVETGQAVRIMTGAPIPTGADCILGQEDTDYGDVIVTVYETLRPYENYCFEGEDYKAGAILMKKGVLLRGPEIGILASLGRTKVQVTRKVRIAVLTTGDEIVLPGEPLKEGQASPWKEDTRYC